MAGPNLLEPPGGEVVLSGKKGYPDTKPSHSQCGTHRWRKMKMRCTPEVVSANVEVGHHAIVDGQEGKVAPLWRLNHAEHIQRSCAALADCVSGRLQ